MSQDTEIEVEDPATTIVAALIGPDRDLFQIRLFSELRARSPTLVQHERRFAYLVNGVEVTPEVYRDAMATAKMDDYCPDCEGGDDFLIPDSGDEPS